MEGKIIIHHADTVIINGDANSSPAQPETISAAGSIALAEPLAERVVIDRIAGFGHDPSTETAFPDDPTAHELQRSGDDSEQLADIGILSPSQIDLVPDAPRDLAPDKQEDRAKKDEAQLEQRAEELVEEEALAEQNWESRDLYLRSLHEETGAIRKKEGRLKTHIRPSPDRKADEKALSDMKKKARETLENACGVCALRDNCTLEGNLKSWIDTKAYANKKGKRAGTRNLRNNQFESRDKFIKDLDADITIHCDPSRRNAKPKPLNKDKKNKS